MLSYVPFLLPFNSHLTFLYFFISILLASACGVTAFILLISGNVESLRINFDKRKRPRALITKHGEILESREDVKFHIEILEEKLKNKLMELDGWKGKVVKAENEIQNLSNTSEEVKRRFLKLKNDMVNSEEDCKKLQKQIFEYRKKQNEIFGETRSGGEHLSSTKSSGTLSLNGSVMDYKTCRLSSLGEKTTNFKERQFSFLPLKHSVTKAFLTVLNAIGIISWKNSPGISLLAYDCLVMQDKLPPSVKIQNGKHVEIENFPFPPKSPPLTTISKIFLWVIKKFQSKKEINDKGTCYDHNCLSNKNSSEITVCTSLYRVQGGNAGCLITNKGVDILYNGTKAEEICENGFKETQNSNKDVTLVSPGKSKNDENLNHKVPQKSDNPSIITTEMLRKLALTYSKDKIHGMLNLPIKCQCQPISESLISNGQKAEETKENNLEVIHMTQNKNLRCLKIDTESKAINSTHIKKLKSLGKQTTIVYSIPGGCASNKSGLEKGKAFVKIKGTTRTTDERKRKDHPAVAAKQVRKNEDQCKMEIGPKFSQKSSTLSHNNALLQNSKISALDSVRNSSSLKTTVATYSSKPKLKANQNILTNSKKEKSPKSA